VEGDWVQELGNGGLHGLIFRESEFHGQEGISLEFRAFELHAHEFLFFLHLPLEYFLSIVNKKLFLFF